jgi:hypothetical protein
MYLIHDCRLPIHDLPLWQRKIMLSRFIIFFKGFKNGLQMLFVSKKICIAGINKQRFNVVLFDVLCISFLQVQQVIIGNILFIAAVTLADILLKFAYRRMQVNKQIRLN